MAQWDAVVIGSGIGGLAAAAALSLEGRRVLVLERHRQLGGLTQSFERDGYHFNVGVHYIGEAGTIDGEPGALKKIFDRLTPGGIEMAPIEPVYDRVILPGLTVEFERPATRLIATLKRHFPHQADGIERYFAALEPARQALEAAFATQAAPQLVEQGMGWWQDNDIDRWVGRTMATVIAEFVDDPRLRAVLAAQWGNHGGRPSVASFAVHAAMTASYLDGAWYPVGGSRSIARQFERAIRERGGELRCSAQVARTTVDSGQVRGVVLENGEAIAAPCVISDAGIRNTLRLLPSEEVDYDWAQDALGLEPSIGHVGVYLGLKGDIAAAGASTANDWIYDSWEVDQLWRGPQERSGAPLLFVSFPSLKDPAHEPGAQQRHTCELVAFVDPSAFGTWERDNMKPGEPRERGYLRTKQHIQQSLVAQLAHRYPKLGPLIDHITVSTPLSVATQTGAEHGAMYGLSTAPDRFMNPALRPHTPIGGLFLAGQDVCCPGVSGAVLGGLMAAVAVEPKLLELLQ